MLSVTLDDRLQETWYFVFVIYDFEYLACISVTYDEVAICDIFTLKYFLIWFNKTSLNDAYPINTQNFCVSLGLWKFFVKGKVMQFI